jgi:hypothetical protein
MAQRWALEATVQLSPETMADLSDGGRRDGMPLLILIITGVFWGYWYEEFRNFVSKEVRALINYEKTDILRF